MITKAAWNCMINKTPVNSFGGSTLTVGLKAFGHKLSETNYSIFMAFHHFWIEYKVLFSSRDRFHYLRFKQVQATA